MRNFKDADVKRLRERNRFSVAKLDFSRLDPPQENLRCFILVAPTADRHGIKISDGIIRRARPARNINHAIRLFANIDIPGKVIG